MAYKQAQNRNKRLLKTYRKTKYKYCAGVWFDEEKGRYVKCTASNTPGYVKSLRKIGNKKVRKAKDVGNFGAYKKLYDYKSVIF